MNKYVTASKRSFSLLVTQIGAGLGYSVLFCAFLLPVGYQIILRPTRDQNSVGLQVALTSFCFIVMSLIGMVLMHRFLRMICNKAEVVKSALSAMMVAPFSAYIHLLIPNWYFEELRKGAILSPLNLFLFGFGFYLPFVLASLFVGYCHRIDEF